MKGILLQIKNVRPVNLQDGTSKTVTDFILKNKEGDHFCSYWGKLDEDLLGKTVEFDSASRKYKGKDYFNVKGKINTLEDEVTETTSTADENETVTTSEPSSEVDRESFREDAEEAVKKNIKSARKLLKAEKIEITGEAMIQLADMIGRTQTALTINKQRG